MKKTSEIVSKFKSALFVASLALGILIIGETSALASWDLASTDTKLRQAIGTILFLIAALLAIKAFAKGRKGVAVAEILVGAFLGIFVASADPLKSLQEFFSSLLGF